MKVFQKRRYHFGPAIAIGIPQQANPVGRRHACAGNAHHPFHSDALDALTVIGFGWRIAFGHQHIAIGQHLQPARMVQPGSQRRDGQTRHRHGHFTRRPAFGRSNVDRGNQCLARRGQCGVGAHRLLGCQESTVGAAGSSQQHSQGDACH